MTDTICTALPDCDPAQPVLIAGPTASGKSALALDLALRQGRQIVNADALQVYDGWRILTARPDEQDLAQAPHKLYGHVDFRRSYSVGDWLRDVAPLLAITPAPVIVGGTGLYFQALLNGLADIPPTDLATRANANERLGAEGLAALVNELDPDTHQRIDLNNPMRVQRAWEVLTQTGRGLASWQDETGPPMVMADQAARFIVNLSRDTLNERIDRRFDVMLATGVWDEVRTMDAHWDPDLQSSRAIGATELIASLRGELPIEEAVTAAKLATRQYAKRQRTWGRSKMSKWTPVVTVN